MQRILWILGISVLVAAVLVSMVVGFYLGPIVKIGIEQIGPKVTKVSIKVDGVDLAVLTGSATIKGLVIGNPAGYTAQQAISVGTIAVSMAPFSVMSQKILIHSVQIKSPEITFEGGLGGNNLSKIASNTNSAPSNANNTTTQTGTKPAPKIEIDDLLITGAKVNVNLTGLGSKVIPLPDIHLTDLGKDSNGLTPAELIHAVLGAITTDTVKAVASSAAGLTQGIQSLGQGAGSTVSDSVNKITSSIGGLLGK